MRATAAHQGKHLSADEVVARLDACPVCLSREHRSPVFQIQRDPDIQLLLCPRCRACSASHMPRAQVLDAYYAAYYDDATESKVTFQAVAHFARYVLRDIHAGALGMTIRILDFGGGDGTVALAMAQELLRRADDQRRVEITVVDFHAPVVSDDPRIGISQLRSYEQIDGAYDIVLASAILEHIPEVNPVFVRLFASVAPRGYFYARTPYAVPLARIIPGLDLTYPAHVHDMGCGFWNRVADIFRFDGRYIASRPSIVESGLLVDPARAVAAHLLKLPARIEGLFSPANRKDRIWTLVGGWEVILRRN